MRDENNILNKISIRKEYEKKNPKFMLWVESLLNL